MADEEQKAATSQQPEQPDEARQSQDTNEPARESEGATDTQESEHYILSWEKDIVRLLLATQTLEYDFLLVEMLVLLSAADVGSFISTT